MSKPDHEALSHAMMLVWHALDITEEEEAKGRPFVWERVAALRTRLDYIKYIHGDGEWCSICNCAFGCPTWRAADGKKKN